MIRRRRLTQKQRRLRQSVALRLAKNMSGKELKDLAEQSSFHATEHKTDSDFAYDEMEQNQPDSFNFSHENSSLSSSSSDTIQAEHSDENDAENLDEIGAENLDEIGAENLDEIGIENLDQTGDGSDATDFDDSTDETSSNEEESLDTGPEMNAVVNKDNTPDWSHILSIGLLSIMDKHSLSYACVNDMVNLLKMSVPNFDSSLHALLKKYVQPKDSLEIHRFCSGCMSLLESDTSCTMSECKANDLPVSSFIEVRVEYQLKLLFTDTNFVKLLKYRFKRLVPTDTICDIYDGSIYKERADFFSSQYNLSFILNYDGAPKFKSSSMQIWPIQLKINELPPILRSSKQYSLLAGLWCSKQKPPSFLFMEPIFKSFKEIEENGIMVTIDGQQKLVKAQLLCTVMDLPAKAALLNVIQYNGEYGCTTCKHPGCTVSIGRGSARAYKFDSNIELRTHVGNLEDARKALKKETIVCGVKGYSPIHTIPTFDTIRCVPVDYMHAVLLGVSKKLATLWFNSNNSSKEWYIGRKISEIDKRLNQIKMPTIVNRSPRSITERKFWKASEWKMFLLFYIPVSLCSILPMKYYVHAFLLIKSMRILLNDHIERTQLRLADKLLSKFCKLMEEYYGLKNCGINVHVLRHLAYYVECFGPLWTHSAFSFEGQMFTFLKKSHASHDIGKQIASTHLLRQRLSIERQLVLGSPLQPIHLLLNSLQSSQASYCGGDLGIEFLGKGSYCDLITEDKKLINLLLQSQNQQPLKRFQAREYNRIIINRKPYSTRQYSSTKKRNNSTIKIMSAPPNYSVYYGIIEKIISLDNFKLAFISKLKITHNGPPTCTSDDITRKSADLLFSDYLHYEESDKCVIFIHQILELCCNLSQTDCNLFSWFPNKIENE